MEAGDPGLWGSYFVRMWGSAGGSEEVMLAPRFLGCTWNTLDKRTRTDQKWMALFLCPSLRIFCVVVTFALLFASHYVVRSWRDKIFWPQILWSPEAKSPNMLSWQKDFSKRKESAQLGERSSWILWDISFLEIVLWDSDWDPKIALFPQYCIRSPEMFGNRDWN